MRNKKTGKRYLAGILSAILMLTSVQGSVANAAGNPGTKEPGSAGQEQAFQEEEAAYVISNTAQEKIHVRINHLLEDDNTRLFRTTDVDLETEERLSEFTYAEKDHMGNAYYTISSVTELKDGQETEISPELKPNQGELVYYVSEDAELNFYYARANGTFTNKTTFFDYVNGNANQEGSINYKGNYPEGSEWNNRLGTIGAADQYKLMVDRSVTVKRGEAVTEENGRFNANAYQRFSVNSGVAIGENHNGVSPRTIYTADNKANPYKSEKDFSWPILTGLVKNLTGSSYEKVNFNYDEPGFFSSEDKAGKKIFTNYGLTFDRTGNKYSLKNVYKNTENNIVCSNMNQFFPLNSENGNKKNEFFGMRYDFTFTIGDYLGEMLYTFTGDDDLWVFVDGKLVLDLGGIHGKYTGSEYNDLTNSLWPNQVDLWEVLTGKSDYTEADKLRLSGTTKHTVTVLYMERGGYASNCSMEFVIPEVQAKEPVVTVSPRANLTFTKTDSQGAALEGASFSLTNGKETYSAVSRADGTVTFTNLKEGSWTLIETQAPQGYLKNDKTWSVEMVVTGTKASATVYDSEGKPVTTIENRELSQVLEQDKTAKVYDEQNRIFQIDLNASSLSKQVVEGTTGTVDVVLVLDASGSMCEYSGTLTGTALTKSQMAYDTYYYFAKGNILYRVEKTREKLFGFEYDKFTVWYEDGSNWGRQNWSQLNIEVPDAVYPGFVSKMEALKISATSFVKLLEERSPQSRVGIAAYSEGLMTTQELTSVGTGKERILSKIQQLSPSSSTYAYYGLEQARQWLGGSKTQTAVVLLSDGEDNGKKAAKETANTLKKNGTSIYSVGFRVHSSAETFLRDISSGEGYYYGASNMEELVNGFQLIAEGAITGVAIRDAVIRDEIDPRFQVVDAQGNPLQEGDNAGGGIVHKDSNGNWYVEWHTEIGTKGTDGTPGWSAAIYVKAKDDFMGGNAILTNGDAYISFQGNKAPFPNPTVNVQLLELEGQEEEITVFLKDPIRPTELAQLLRDNIFTSGTEITEEELRSLAEGTATEIVKEYSYGTANDVVGAFTYTYGPKVGSAEPHLAERTGKRVEDYQLHVSYTPLSVAEREEAGHSRPANDGGTPVTEKKEAQAHCYVNVVAGSIEITKEISGAFHPGKEGDPVFTFRITRQYEGNTETYYRTVRFDDERTQEQTAELLDQLPRGVYTVEELHTQRYDSTSVEDGGGSVKGTVAQNAISFQIGTGENQDNYTALDGKAIFINTKTEGGKRTDTDVVMNRFYYEDGAWHVSQETVPQSPSYPGTKNTLADPERMLPERKHQQDEEEPEETR